MNSSQGFKAVCMSNIVSFLNVYDLRIVCTVSKMFMTAVEQQEELIKRCYSEYFLINHMYIVTMDNKFNPYILVSGVTRFRCDFWMHLNNDFLLHSMDDDLWHVAFPDLTGISIPAVTMPIRDYDKKMNITKILDVIIGGMYTLIKWEGGIVLVDGIESKHPSNMHLLSGDGARFCLATDFSKIPRQAKRAATEFYVDCVTGIVILVSGVTYYISKFKTIGELFIKHKKNEGLPYGALPRRLHELVENKEKELIKKNTVLPIITKKKVPKKITFKKR